jgi:hypothetical protein
MVSLAEIEELNAEIVSDPNWQQGTALFFDSSEVENRAAETPSMTSMADTVAKMNGEFSQSKMAMFVKNDLQYGLARQYQMLAESRSTTRIEVFRDKNAAIDWLLTEEMEKAL